MIIMNSLIATCYENKKIVLSFKVDVDSDPHKKN